MHTFICKHYEATLKKSDHPSSQPRPWELDSSPAIQSGVFPQQFHKVEHFRTRDPILLC